VSASGDRAFETFLVVAVYDALVRTFDASTAQAVQFYIDTGILVKNPDAYADSVMRMFGKVGGEVVINSIMESLSEKANIPATTKWSSLRDCVAAVAKRYRAQ